MLILKYLLLPLSLYAFAALLVAFATWSLEPFNPASWGQFFRYVFAIFTGIAWITFFAVDLEELL